MSDEEDTPPMAEAEIINVSDAKPVTTQTGSPTIFNDDYLIANVLEKKRKSPVEGKKYIPKLPSIFTAHKEKKSFNINKIFKNKQPREVVDVDIHKVNKVCKHPDIKLDLEQFAISEIEANLLTKLIHENSDPRLISKDSVLENYCKIKMAIHELQPELEDKMPQAYYYLLAIPGGLFIEKKIKTTNDIKEILTDERELGRLNRSSKATDFYKSLKFEYSHGVRIGLHPRIDALDALENASNNNHSRFRIPQGKGGRYTRKTKGSKRKSRKSNK
jgi:hypothetical protein